jgi:hypothetical protein
MTVHGRNGALLESFEAIAWQYYRSVEHESAYILLGETPVLP